MLNMFRYTFIKYEPNMCHNESHIAINTRIIHMKYTYVIYVIKANAIQILTNTKRLMVVEYRLIYIGFVTAHPCAKMVALC